MKSAKFKIIVGIVLLLVGGLVIPVGLLVPAFNAPNEEVVFESPGEASLQIEAPGRFYLWHEHRTIHDGHRVVRDEHLPDGLSIELTRASDGSTVEFEPLSNISVEFGDNKSRSVGYVDVERPGRFGIEVSGGDDEMRVMSFSRSRFTPLTRAIGLTLLSMVLLGAVGIALTIFGIVQRAGERRNS